MKFIQINTPNAVLSSEIECVYENFCPPDSFYLEVKTKSGEVLTLGIFSSKIELLEASKNLVTELNS